MEVHTRTCMYMQRDRGDELAADAPIILEGCCESWSVIAKDGSSFPLTSLPQRVGGELETLSSAEIWTTALSSAVCHAVFHVISSP